MSVMPERLSDAEVLAAIRANHRKANISGYEARADAVIHWEQAWIDPGGVLWGSGPYAKVPITFKDEGPAWDIVVRVYPPEWLRKRLHKQWERAAERPGEPG